MSNHLHTYCEGCAAITPRTHIHYERPSAACDTSEREIDDMLADDAVVVDEGEWRR